ncbi:hypothetical protein BJ742DRAFT_854833 [Cladochytrium replicatum]|nr:hypothetical protein BJ742DRAFT_854833 [Cladochytrium replicatum]
MSAPAATDIATPGSPGTLPASVNGTFTPTEALLLSSLAGASSFLVAAIQVFDWHLSVVAILSFTMWATALSGITSALCKGSRFITSTTDFYSVVLPLALFVLSEVFFLWSLFIRATKIVPMLNSIYRQLSLSVVILVTVVSLGITGAWAFFKTQSTKSTISGIILDLAPLPLALLALGELALVIYLFIRYFLPRLQVLSFAEGIRKAWTSGLVALAVESLVGLTGAALFFVNPALSWGIYPLLLGGRIFWFMWFQFCTKHASNLNMYLPDASNIKPDTVNAKDGASLKRMNTKGSKAPRGDERESTPFYTNGVAPGQRDTDPMLSKEYWGQNEYGRGSNWYGQFGYEPPAMKGYGMDSRSGAIAVNGNDGFGPHSNGKAHGNDVGNRSYNDSGSRNYGDTGNRSYGNDNGSRPGYSTDGGRLYGSDVGPRSAFHGETGRPYGSDAGPRGGYTDGSFSRAGGYNPSPRYGGPSVKNDAIAGTTYPTMRSVAASDFTLAAYARDETLSRENSRRTDYTLYTNVDRYTKRDELEEKPQKKTPPSLPEPEYSYTKSGNDKSVEPWSKGPRSNPPPPDQNNTAAQRIILPRTTSARNPPQKSAFQPENIARGYGDTNDDKWSRERKPPNFEKAMNPMNGTGNSKSSKAAPDVTPKAAVRRSPGTDTLSDSFPTTPPKDTPKVSETKVQPQLRRLQAPETPGQSPGLASAYPLSAAAASVRTSYDYDSTRDRYTMAYDDSLPRNVDRSIIVTGSGRERELESDRRRSPVRRSYRSGSEVNVIEDFDDWEPPSSDRRGDSRSRERQRSRDPPKQGR